MREAHPQPDLAELGEFVRRVVADHREVTIRWPEVLPEGDNVDVAAAQVAQAGDHLIPLLAHAEDDPRLGEGGGIHGARVRQHTEGTVIPAARTGSS